jgi:ATP-binding cassette subfamily B protein/subfamily B ATP-binding cassette protein MsbA
MHRRIASRLALARYLEERREKRAEPDAKKKAGERGRSLGRLYRELIGVLRGSRLLLISAMMMLTVATLVRLVPPAATKLVIDNVLAGKSLPTTLPGGWSVPWSWPTDARAQLLALVGLVMAVSVVGTAFGLASRWFATKVSKRVQVKVRRKAFAHAVRLPLHRVHQLKSGGAASLLREDAGGAGELVFSMLFNPGRAIVQLAGGLIILAFVDARFLLGSLLLAPAVIGSDRLWNRLLRPLYRDVRKQRQELDAKTTEVFGGMRVVRAFGRQRTEASRFLGTNNLLVRQEMYAWWWSRIVEVLWDLLMPAASGALLLYGGLQVLEGRLTLGDLMMFLVYLAMLLEPIAVLASSFTQLQNNLAGFERVLDMMDEPRELERRPGARGVAKKAVRGRISLEGVGYQYPASDAWVLRGIDFAAEPGTVVALVGRSGSGKTTLCNLVARFFDPTEGSIKLDGVDLRDVQVESYRHLLGIVEQDVFLFDGTVAENIAYADRKASRAALENAARVAHALEFINELPDGFETIIGERGVRLSGGQRQRLAIARAVLADPKVLILDEATSNLDSESERLIQRGMAGLMAGRTTFVIAHRLSTIRAADQILVLDAGRIVEAGTHDQLMSGPGLYRDLVELQRLEHPEIEEAGATA